LANAGWQFENWNGTGQGSYTGNNATCSAVVNAPLSETAIFYPGLTVHTSNNITVSYVYGTNTGSIPQNISSTIFAPKGTNIMLSAKPTLFIFSFGGWVGETTTSASNISTVLNSPQSLTANFEYNYLNIGLLGAGIVILIVIIVLLITRKPRVKML
jgi:hypothetical protein